MSKQNQKRRQRALRRKHEKQICSHCRRGGATVAVIGGFLHDGCRVEAAANPNTQSPRR